MPVIRCALLSLTLISAVCPTAQAAVSTQLDSVNVRAYNIAPGPLGATLASFAVEAGIALSFEPALTDRLFSPRLSGTYSTQEAVTRLLAGSGLDMQARGDGSYILVQRRVTLEQTPSAPAKYLPTACRPCTREVRWPSAGAWACWGILTRWMPRSASAPTRRR